MAKKEIDIDEEIERIARKSNFRIRKTEYSYVQLWCLLWTVSWDPQALDFDPLQSTGFSKYKLFFPYLNLGGEKLLMK